MILPGKAPAPRKGMPEVRLDEAEYKKRVRAQSVDPAFDSGSAPTAARTLLEAVQARRGGRLVSAGDSLEQPRQK